MLLQGLPLLPLHQALQRSQLPLVLLQGREDGAAVGAGHQGAQFRIAAADAARVGKATGGQGPHEALGLDRAAPLIRALQQGGTDENGHVGDQGDGLVMGRGWAFQPVGADGFSQGPDRGQGV